MTQKYEIEERVSQAETPNFKRNCGCYKISKDFGFLITTVLRLHHYLYWSFLTMHQYRTIMLTLPNMPNCTLKVQTQKDSFVVQFC